MATHDRILSSLKNGPARRNLFGPVDREQLQVEYQTALRKDLEEASQRWGFDFISDKPLASSDFQWEWIPGAQVPLLYRSCMRDLRQAAVQSTEEATVKKGRVEPPQIEKENVPHTPGRCVHNPESLEKTPEREETSGLKRKQTNITGTDLNIQIWNDLWIYVSLHELSLLFFIPIDFYHTKRRIVWMPRKSGEWFPLQFAARQYYAQEYAAQTLPSHYPGGHVPTMNHLTTETSPTHTYFRFN